MGKDSPKVDVLSTKSNRFLIIGIFLFFGSQIYLPLRYYWSDHPWDERFSWRMFSTVRQLKCVPKMWIGDPNGRMWCPDQSGDRCSYLRITKDVHMVWFNLLKRGRLAVLDRFIDRQCKTYSRSLFVSWECPDPTPPHAMIQIHSPETNVCEASSRQTL